MSYSQPIRFDALIIDPETSNRNRLKQACSAVSTFGKVNHSGSIVEALRVLTGNSKSDVVFVPKSLGQDAVAAFIRDAKATPAGQDTAYILVLSENEASAAVAQSVLGGADGLLFAPYSVDQLVEITVLAAKVRRDRTNAREEAAFRLLISDVIKQIDLLAYAKSCGYDAGIAFKAFKQGCSVLSNLTPESSLVYQRIAIDSFMAAPIPSILTEKKKYVGASSRVKRKAGEKVMTEFAALMASGNQTKQ